MKKVVFILGFGFATLALQPSHAQVSIQVNIGSQPAWGPTGYDYAQFYYIPDLNCYYDIARAMYIFLNPNSGYWYYTSQLPPSYRDFDLYNHYKVVVNRSRPYEMNRQDRVRYANYKGSNQSQPVIRDSKDEKYFESNGHPQHQQWVSQHGGQTNNQPQNNGNNAQNSGGNGEQRQTQNNNRQQGHGNNQERNNNRGNGGKQHTNNRTEKGR